MQEILTDILTFMQDYQLILGILFPFLISLLIAIFARERERAAIVASVFALLVSIFFISLRGLELLPFDSSSPAYVEETLLWIPTINISFGFMLDGLNFPIMIFAFMLTLFVIIFSRQYYGKSDGIGGYYANLLFLYAGMLGVFASTDIFLFYLFWEITIIPAFILLIFWREEGVTKVNARETGIKFFLWTHIGSLIMLMGIVLVFMLTGTSSMIDIPSAISAVATENLRLFQFAAIAMIFGFSVKLGIFPLHSWLPDTYVQSASPATAMIAGLLAKIGAYGLVRVTASWFPFIISEWVVPLGIVAAISILYGSYLALAQSNLKRRWAFSSISQGGYILLGAISVSLLGISGAALHIINHAILKTLLFLVTGSYLMILGTDNIEKLRGVGSRMPVVSAAFLIAAFGMAGIPPLNGFISEVLIFSGIFTVSGALIVALISASAIIWTFVYVLGPIYNIFVASPEGELANAKDPSAWQKIPIIIAALFVFILGIWPNLVLVPINQWINTLSIGGP